MATETQPISVNHYLAMILDGTIPHDARLELLDGRLVEQMTKYAPHTFTVDGLAEAFRLLLPGLGWVVREEKPLILGQFWRPEPDIAIVIGPKDRYRKDDPLKADVALLIEVADSSYATDRGEKWRAYAAARIPIYWIVNINKSQVEVYRDPIGRGKTARYRQTDVFTIDAEVPVVIDGQEVGRIVVKEILP
jgi:Uma2 family endonuclease